MHILQSMNGLYTPSFFCIKVDSIGTDRELYSDQIFPTVMHELIHFVQRLSSSIGYVNMQNNANLLADFSSKNRIQKLPLPYRSKEPIKEINRDLFSIYLASNSYLRLPKSVSFSLPSEEMEITGGAKIPYHEVIVDNATDVFSFSAISILEGMANIFENWFYPSQTTHFDIPYDLPYIVANLIFPKICTDVRNVFALCDASLMHYHSADVFVNMLP